MRKQTLTVVFVAFCLSALSGSATAQDQDEVAANEALAKAVQNPLASLVSLPFQANYNNGVGEYDRTFFNLNIQPVVPFHPNENWNVITRTIIPVNSVPIGETDSVFGIGDTSLSVFLSPAKASSLTWGVGPAINLPSASNPELLGSGKLSLGPTGVVFYGVGKWTMGVVSSNVWSIGGDSDREDVNFFFAQWFVNFNFGGGWALGSAPILTANWKADPGNKWVIPWGLQVSKVSHVGATPINVIIGYYKNSKHPEGGADNQVRVQVNLLYPQKPK
jgi:hypothetical protein